MVAPWVIYAAIAAVSAGVSYVTAKSAQKKAKQASKANEGLLINSEGANNHIPVIYGSRRIAGTRVFVETGPGPRGANDYLYMIFVLCEGEVEDVTDFLIDDAPTTDPRFAYSDSIAINTYVGTDAQTVDPMFDAAGIGWDTGYDLKGLCYIAVRLKWNPDAFSAIPNITALVTGKKVYDPRTATTAYSTNPALCIRDYLTNDRYGKGLDSSLIDDTALNAAATFYDTTVTYWTSGTVGKLFEFNMVLDTEQDILENIKDMLMCCRGFLPYTNGLYQLLPDKSSSSVFAFTTDEIIGGLSIRGESKDEKYNRVACTFIDPENNWQENTAIWPESGSAEETTYLAEDGGVELVGDFDLPCITNYYAARDIARIFLARSRNALRASFVATSEALNLTVGDVVTVTHPTPGWSAKPFQVEQITINYDGTVGVSLLEYDSSIYTYDPASEQVAYADTNLPNPFDVAAPTSFVVTETTYLAADGTVIPEISVAWTAAADAFVAYYEFQFKIDTGSVWNSVVTYEPIYSSAFATVGETYDIRARSVNSSGVRSDWLTGTYTVAGDTAGPATPTGLTIVGSYNEAVAKWTACADKDYKETILYASLTNDFATATEQVRVSGTTVTYYNLPLNTTYYAWLKHVDFSGNLSTVSAAVTFTTTTGITTSQLADGSVTEVKIGSSAVTAGKIGTNAVTSAKINSSAVTEAKIATGAVTVNKIGAGAVTNAKLAASAVAANVFAAGVQPITIVTSVPGTKSTDAIFNTTDGKLYRWNGSAYVKSVENDDIVSVVADKITAGTINAAITTTNVLQLSTAGKIYTAGKTSAASTTAGVFLGHDGTSSYDFAVGDATRSIVYDGSAGSFTITNVDIVSTGYMYAQGGYNDGTYTGAIYAQPSDSGQRGLIGRSTGAGVGTTGRTNTGVGLQGIADSNTGIAIQAVAASASGVAIDATVGNVLVGAATNTGQGNVIIKNGVAGTRLGDQIIILSQDSGDAQATLHLIVEEDVVAGTGPLASTGIDQIKIRINGVEYWLPVVAV
jgi:hypothetical protein